MNISHDVSFGDLLTACSVLLALMGFLWDRQKTREAAEIATFDAINEKWVTLLEKFVEYPDIILDFGEQRSSIAQPEKKKILYCHMLVSTLEMAYLRYQRAPKHVRNEWQGWDQYIARLFTTTELRSMWEEQLFEEYDESFVEYVNSKIRSATPGGQQPR